MVSMSLWLGVLGWLVDEAEQEVAGELRGGLEQVGEVHGLVQILAVGVDVLAQQG